MNTQSIIAELDKEIGRLQVARNALTNLTETKPVMLTMKPRHGTISKAGRARIAAAQRKRWAAVKAAKSNRAA